MSEITIKVQGLSRRHLLLGVGGLALAVILAVGAIIYIRQHTTLVGLPRDAYKDLSFEVYFPKSPPNEFKFDAKSISSTPEVLTYKYDYEGNPVMVSVQPLDPQLDTGSFRPTREISTDIGKGYLAEYDMRTTVAILAGKSLVIINSPDNVPSFAVEQFAHTFKRVD
jgi:hypothetical protein